MATVVITGGAGFVGSHLCDAFIARGDRVVCVDNFSSGRRSNVDHLTASPAFVLVEGDVRHGPADAIEAALGRDETARADIVLHFASPASPAHYLQHPILTLETGSIGTQFCLELARRHEARFVLASTSEVYGDPAEHPQTEAYWGNVNPIGPRSVYDEAKRYAEAITMAYRRTFDMNTGIVRIFNTYGPRMRADDGRVVSNFINQALAGEPITLFGDGEQTRSFCYVSDLVAGVLAMSDADHPGPVNLGNPTERTVAELGRAVVDAVGSRSTVEHRELPTDDPTRRCPDISLAKAALGWAPTVELEAGLSETIAWFAAVRVTD